MPKPKTSSLTAILDRLEDSYGRLVPSDDAVEAGVMTLLAFHAPKLSHERYRNRLRAEFVDWNEARVAEPWDVVSALEGPGRAAARRFANAMLKFLSSLHSTLNRCAFDRVLADPDADVAAVVGRMRGAPPYTRNTMLAVLQGGWQPGPEMAKAVQQLGLVKRTTSIRKVAKELEAQAGPDDRVRAHYLLTRYAIREQAADDPLATRLAKKARAAKKPARKRAARKPVAESTKKKTTRPPVAKKKTKPAAANKSRKTTKPTMRKK